MQASPDTDPIRARAQYLLQGGTVGNPLVAASGQVETPVAVRSPEGRLHSWFVPVTSGKRLAGFFQFLPDGTFMRFSSFQRKADELSGCPEAADWLERDRIRGRAEAKRGPDEKGGEPFLTYDRTPDRLVWAVPLKKAGGGIRLIYVAGETVYEPPPAEV